MNDLTVIEGPQPADPRSFDNDSWFSSKINFEYDDLTVSKEANTNVYQINGMTHEYFPNSGDPWSVVVPVLIWGIIFNAFEDTLEVVFGEEN